MLKSILAAGIIATLPFAENESEISCSCNDPKLGKKEGVLYDVNSNTPFTGNCFEFVQVHRISQLKKKKLSGDVLTALHNRKVLNVYSAGVLVARDEFYISGTVAAKYIYKGTSKMGFALQDGVQQRWYENGKTQFKGSFVSGVPSGEWNFFNHLGQISEIIIIKTAECFENNSGFHYSAKIEGERISYNEKGIKSESKKYRGLLTDEKGVSVTEFINGSNTGQPGKIK